METTTNPEAKMTSKRTAAAEADYIASETRRLTTNPEAKMTPGNLRCDVCGEPPWWSLPRVGDPCFDDDGGHLVADKEVR